MKQPKKSYVTLKDGGCDFRQMAKIMTAAGYKMNHATARNQLIVALEELVSHASGKMKIKHKRSEIFNIANSQQVQDNLSDILRVAYSKLKQEEKENNKNGKNK
jgi:hypothetical protein